MYIAKLFAMCVLWGGESAVFAKLVRMVHEQTWPCKIFGLTFGGAVWSSLDGRCRHTDLVPAGLR